MDVNVYFDDTSHFERTAELALFDSFGIDLFHGWTADPQDDEIYQFVKDLNYNTAVEKVINYQSNSRENILEGAAVSRFLDDSANQLTYNGLFRLMTDVPLGMPCVLFRMNHFSVIKRMHDAMYVLVTDIGYQSHANIIWEQFSSVDGQNSFFTDGHFRRTTTSELSSSSPPPPPPRSQMSEDALLARRFKKKIIKFKKNFEKTCQNHQNRIKCCYFQRNFVQKST